jgi:hypothetical protein
MAASMAVTRARARAAAAAETALGFFDPAAATAAAKYEDCSQSSRCRDGIT